MKDTFTKNIVLAMFLAIAFSPFISCSEDNESATISELKFKGKEDAGLSTDSLKRDLYINFMTDAPLSAIEVVQVPFEDQDIQDWCTAAVKSISEVVVSTQANETYVKRFAKFEIRVKDLTPLIFYITQNSKQCKIHSDIQSEDDPKDKVYSYTATAQNPVAFESVITTNAPFWYAELVNIINVNEPITYCTLTTVKGISGNKVRVQFKGNNTTGAKLSGAKLVLFTGNAKTIEVMIDQDM